MNSSPVSEESILARLAECHDVFEARWLIEDVCEAKIFCKMEEYPISDDLYKAAKKVYDAKNLVDAEKLTLEFINTHCK